MQTAPDLRAEPRAARAAATPRPAARRRVTDAPTRTFHALFALSFALAWASGDSEHWRALHVTAGYTMVGLLLFRIVYGFVGPRPARWSSLAARVSGAAAGWRAATAAVLRCGAMPWRQGQNLLMAAIVVALLAGVLPLALSGHATYAEWGGDWLEDVHEAFADAMLTIVVAHLGLIALLSALRRHNLALPMLTGRVSGAGPDLVPSQRTWLAGVLLASVIGLGAWQWSESPQGLLPSSAQVTAHASDDD